MKSLSRVAKGSIGLFRVLYFLLAIVVILIAAYILGGYAFLAKGIWGTDMGSALSAVAWVDKYFPRVPFWYPLAGGGVSLTHSYPIFSFYLVALLKRLTSLDLIQAFRVLGFSSVPLMALGIYAFVALRFKNQTAAFIASLLYLVSPIAWVWLFDWGFYAEAVSHMFVMPAIICWDLFFTSFLDSVEKIRNRLYFALTVVFLSLAFLTHFYTGLSLIMLFGFYVIGYTIKAKERKKILMRGILALSLVGLLTFGLTAFTTLPFYHYTKIAAEAGVGVKSYEYFKESKMTVDHILGLRPLTEDYHAARHISFPAIVSLLAVLGIFLSFWNARSFTLALFSIVALTLFFNPDFLFWISSHAPQIVMETFNRRPPLILLRFILPTLAALGAIGIFKIPFFWIKGQLSNWVIGVFASLGGLMLVVGGLYWFGHFPKLERIPFGYGSQDIDLRNIWGTSKGLCFQGDQEEVCFGFKTGWPKFETTKILSGPAGKLEQLEQTLNRISSENPLARLDFSVYQGPFGMLAPYFNRGRNLSQIYIYAGGSTLINQFWSQQIGVFYSGIPFYGEDPNLINNLSRWFGINYVFFDQHTDPKFFREGGWELWDGNWEEGVLKFPKENSLVDLTTRPAVLVIGQDKVGAYNQVFRLGSLGIFPYEDALLVWGKEAVDDYGLSELSQFDVLLLHGYTYKNRQKADKLLADYVKSGGNIFIDTGWQYTVPDWETEENKETLEILPLKKLLWRDLGKINSFVLEDERFGSGVDISQFSPLIYDGQSWSVSTSEKSNLRDGARVVLSGKGFPLIVTGEFGRGRVVWSGMNIFPHIKQGEKTNYEEIKFLTNLFSWLAERKFTSSFPITYQREYPDKLEFSVEAGMPSGGFLLWKEAYYPDFHARLITSNQSSATSLKIYRGGPGFVLIKVPELEKGDKIIYEYRQPIFEKVFFCLSLSTFLFLLSILVEGVLLKEKSLFLRLIQFGERKLHFLLFELWKKPFAWWNREEEE